MIRQLILCFLATVSSAVCMGSRLPSETSRLTADRTEYTAGVSQNIVLNYDIAQRMDGANVYILVPHGIRVTLDNTIVNVVGRGETSLRGLAQQSVGRLGSLYKRHCVGKAKLIDKGIQGTEVCLSDLDLRPKNGVDIQLVIRGAVLSAKDYTFQASYISSMQSTRGIPMTVKIKGVWKIADLKRSSDERATLSLQTDFSFALFTWTPLPDAPKALLMASVDSGRTWKMYADLNKEEYNDQLYANKLDPNQLYAFRIDVLEGKYKGQSNVVWYYSGMYNVRAEGVKADGITDDAQAIDQLIDKTSEQGGGVIYFPKGEYAISTVHLKSNVWLYIDEGATIKALWGGDKMEKTWFDNKDYRYGLSPTSMGPYKDVENFMTKQDVGHSYFRNAMFVGERIENVKIIGQGRITGDGHLVTSDKVMNNPTEKQHDKMFSLKLCSNVEIGGIQKDNDLWYDEQKNAPYYLTGKSDSTSVSNMLHIDQAGHFVLLATGCDGVNVHDTYFGKNNNQNVRDIYDFMGCNNVKVKNIYVTVSSDDIVKLGSDCSLGFTRPGSNYWVRNIIGDTNCNLFQIGSETADDITDVAVDNIYVLGANKAGFSISVNDGSFVRNVFLNSGKTGPLHHRSVMKRTRAPFFVSLSNRGRVLGAKAEMFTFKENDSTRRELLITNIPIGEIRNVKLKGVDISEVYGGSSFRSNRWKAYDGSQKESAAIFAGFSLPKSGDIIEGRPFTLPDGHNKRYVRDLSISDINLLVKGGHPAIETNNIPPEIGVGRYNVGDLKVLPAYGFWFRHVKGLKMSKCNIKTETEDGRQPIVLDDVLNSDIQNN